MRRVRIGIDSGGTATGQAPGFDTARQATPIRVRENLVVGDVVEAR